jgi:poly(A) polymerase
VTEQPSKPSPSHERALVALDWAVERAEGRDERADPAPFASLEDYRLAADKHRLDVRNRLDRLMMADDAEGGLDALLDCGALSALLQPVERLVGFGDGEWRHKDVWKHTKQVVRQATPKLEVRWAALLHDIGKVKTRSITPDGQVHFFGHAEVGARMFDKMDRRVPLFVDDAALRSSVRFLVLHHLRASQYSKSWTDSAVRRFAREMGAHMDDLFCLSRADITTKRPERKRRGLRQIDLLATRVSELAAKDAVQPLLPKGLGNAIMKTFGLPPSRLIGRIMHNLELAVRAGQLPPQADAQLYVDHLRDNPGLLEPEG